MNDALLSCLGIATALVTGAQGGRWLAATPDPQAQLAAELIALPAAHADRVDGSGAIPIRRANDGMFYVEGRVNGTIVRFLVDTGASHTVLTRGDAARAGLRADRSRDIVTATGAIRFGWGTLDRMSLAGHDMAGAIAAIADDRLPVSLLGQDMLSRLATVRISGDTLWLS